MRSRSLDWFCLSLVILGAINWGLVGFFQYDLIAGIFGGMSGAFSRLIYVLVGAAGLYCLSLYRRRDIERDHISHNNNVVR